MPLSETDTETLKDKIKHIRSQLETYSSNRKEIGLNEHDGPIYVLFPFTFILDLLKPATYRNTTLSYAKAELATDVELMLSHILKRAQSNGNLNRPIWTGRAASQNVFDEFETEIQPCIHALNEKTTSTLDDYYHLIIDKVLNVAIEKNKALVNRQSFFKTTPFEDGLNKILTECIKFINPTQPLAKGDTELKTLKY